MQDSLSLRELLNLGTEQLEANGVENARGDALELINMVKKVDKTDMLLYPDMKFSKAEAEEVKKLFDKRAERIPLQHILGKACFYGHEFYVNENVLIPRFDTEIIVDEVLKYIKNERRGEALKILDMCTGSGCIAISLAMENEKLECLGADISLQALEIAQKNKKSLKAGNVDLIQSDLFSKVEGKFDIIVSNPPYIDKKELNDLSPEVAEHDPHLALFAEDGGLYFYRKIAKEAGAFLNVKGKIFFEIGYDQAEDVAGILSNEGYSDICLIKDYGGNDRVIIGKI
ncbi:MAG: peptide chain release factor N(5)-glutamine methyltransferase [Clostridiales bacterium]|nr:peptide chain release factor N(5)-glutamine methyltransferase [Clostridiales bacterium]MBS5877163.1 peptide chain release factor N(5)-glutamine methyltransferase [Clostridiales bacterium]MDU0938996.1 peptide chain release factor N(5)-glutamine methyltransferase [Clostridiales bacterium]MDU1041869.1 peptide chain release factor N(5)-glutamine methyltransferase [Clostridiales bacterium]